MATVIKAPESIRVIQPGEVIFPKAPAPGLTWHDAAATSIGIAAGLVVLAALRGWDWPFVSSYRGATAALWILGMAMCSVGATNVETLKGPFLTTAAVLGSAAMVVAIAGVIVSSEALFLALAALTLSLWIVATLRHALGRR